MNVFAGTFRAFDYVDREKNLRLYDSTTPPDYELHKITTPVALFSSDNDWLATPEVTNIFSQGTSSSTLLCLRMNIEYFFLFYFVRRMSTFWAWNYRTSCSTKECQAVASTITTFYGAKQRRRWYSKNYFGYWRNTDDEGSRSSHKVLSVILNFREFISIWKKDLKRRSQQINF